MEEEFYAIVKLVSGEEIMALVSSDENNDDPILICQNPIVMKMIYNPNGHYVKIKQWIELCDDDMYMIKLDKIITITETKDEKIIEIYNRFLEDNREPIELKPSKQSLSQGPVVPDSRMGYVSSVEEARKKLETIYKINPKTS
tara:strand:+ start:495 stop:923 length:429 start_codon:yes stop_codon:yes gene_type:complete